jgi:hypothetical protein
MELHRRRLRLRELRGQRAGELTARPSNCLLEMARYALGLKW